MAQQRENIFEAYKPFRNHLQKCEVTNSLEVIQVFSQHLQSNSDFPFYTEVPIDFLEKVAIRQEARLNIFQKVLLINFSGKSRVSIMNSIKRQ